MPATDYMDDLIRAERYRDLACERRNDQTIAAAARLNAEFDKIIAGIRAGQVTPDRRNDLEKDQDEERDGSYR